MILMNPPVDRLIEAAMEEDLAYGDVTSDNLFDAQHTSVAVMRVKQPAVMSGLSVAQRVFDKVDSALAVTLLHQDGDCVSKDTVVMRIEGPTLSLLKAERLALNFVQHLSGIATLTYQYASTISQTQAKITHTRKTIPGLRSLERQAVIDGGGSPHRSSLSAAALIKDNHIQAFGSVQAAVARLRESVGHTVKIEVECDTIAQVEAALEAKADIIMLDNMTIEQMQSAVSLINKRAVVEASGGITLRSVLAVAQTGVDILSTSDITLSAPAVDVGLDFSTP